MLAQVGNLATRRALRHLYTEMENSYAIRAVLRLAQQPVVGKCVALVPDGGWFCLDCGRRFYTNEGMAEHEQDTRRPVRAAKYASWSPRQREHRLAWLCSCGQLEGVDAPKAKPSGRARRPVLER